MHNDVTLNQVVNVAGRITGEGDVNDLNAGIVWGNENGLKTDNEAATRGEVLKALYVAAGSPAVADTSIVTRFNDAASIPADMAVIVAWAAQNGILKGTDAGNAVLNAYVTCGQPGLRAGQPYQGYFGVRFIPIHPLQRKVHIVPFVITAPAGIPAGVV